MKKVRINHATVGDLLHHARILKRRAKSEAELAEAELALQMAETALGLSGYKLDVKLIELLDASDAVWFGPTSETRQ